MKWHHLLATGLGLLLPLFLSPAIAWLHGPFLPVVPPSARIRALTWLGCDPPPPPEELARWRDQLGVTHVALLLWANQPRQARPEVHYPALPGSDTYWADPEPAVLRALAAIREAGLRPILKLHLHVEDDPGGWAGVVRMTSEADWSAWFASYTAYVLRAAALARENHVALLCIGTELSAAAHREADWRRLIGQVRRRAPSLPLAYGANWQDEYTVVRFWDALDFVALNTYFPLDPRPAPTTEQLQNAWVPRLREIQSIVLRAHRPLLFTEMGYNSRSDSTAHPHFWPEAPGGLPPDPALQARAYEAFFRTFWPRPETAGVLVWVYQPGDRRTRPRPRWHSETDFSPQGKPAEAVLPRWFRPRR